MFHEHENVFHCFDLCRGNLLSCQLLVIDCCSHWFKKKKNQAYYFHTKETLLMVLMKSCVSYLLYTDVTCVKTFFAQLFCCVSADHLYCTVWKLTHRITSCDFFTLLHLVLVYLILVLPFISIRHHRFWCPQSVPIHFIYKFCHYNYWFYSSVMKFTFLPDFFEHLPPCRQAIGVISVGATTRVCIVVLFFPRDLSFTPLLHRTGLLFPFLLE